MRCRAMSVGIFVVALAFLVSSTGLSQQRPGKGKGGGGGPGGGPGGGGVPGMPGPGGGGKGPGGGGPMMFMQQITNDPDAWFAKNSKGKDYIVLADMFWMRSLQDYAKENGITEKITKDQFGGFVESLKAKIAAGGGTPGAPGAGGPGPGGGGPG